MTVEFDDLTEEQQKRVIQTRGFQKMVAYTKLADGIEVLEEQDAIFDSMVTSITEKHSQVRSEESVEQFFELFVDEVMTYTEQLTEEDDDETPESIDAMLVDEDGAL
jgi:hypothetical protein